MESTTPTQRSALAAAVIHEILKAHGKAPPRAVMTSGVGYYIEALTKKDPCAFGQPMSKKSGEITHFLKNHLLREPQLQWRQHTNQGYIFWQAGKPRPSIVFKGKGGGGKRVITPLNTAHLVDLAEPVAPQPPLPPYNLEGDIHFDEEGAKNIVIIAEPGYKKTIKQMTIASDLVNNHCPRFRGIVVAAGKPTTHSQVEVVSSQLLSRHVLKYFPFSDPRG